MTCAVGADSPIIRPYIRLMLSSTNSTIVSVIAIAMMPDSTAIETSYANASISAPMPSKNILKFLTTLSSKLSGIASEIPVRKKFSTNLVSFIINTVIISGLSLFVSKLVTVVGVGLGCLLV